MSYDPVGRSFHVPKDFGIQVVSNLDYLKRRGLLFTWGANLFDGCVFGTRVGPVNCLLSGGFHDLAHAIDFLMRGRRSNIHRYGMSFSRLFANPIYLSGIGEVEQGFPKTSQITRSEIRTFAIQAWLMEKEIGYLVELADYDERDAAEKAGILPPRRKQEGFSVIQDNGILHSVSVEEFAEKQSELVVTPGFEDLHIYMKESLGVSMRRYWQMEVKERRGEEKAKEFFKRDLLDHYERIRTNPFTQNRLNRALNQLCSILRSNQKSREFQFNPEKHYGTPA